MEKLIEIIKNVDIIAAIFTILVVITASTKNWLVAVIKLKPAYMLMIILGVFQSALNTYLAMSIKGQEALILLNIPAVWVSLMGIKGLRNLKRQDKIK
jgi:hypothetical protein